MASKVSTQAEISSADIVIYISKSCPYCTTAVRDLQSNGFKATILEPNPSQRSVSRKQLGVILQR